MIFKKALIALLLAGGAISFTACGKKNKPTTTQAPTPVTPDDPTPSPTPAPVVIDYENNPDVSKYTPYKLGLKDKLLLQYCFDNINKANYSDMKYNQSQNMYAYFGGSKVGMKEFYGGEGKLYKNDVLVLNNSMQAIIEGNLPEELMYMFPDEYKVKVGQTKTIAATTNYVFTSQEANVENWSSSMGPAPASSKEVMARPSTYKIKETNDFYPDSTAMGYLTTDIDVYKIDDKHFVAYYTNLVTDESAPSETRPEHETALVYDPETKTFRDGGYIDYYFETLTYYFSTTSDGMFQLDYLFGEKGRKSFSLNYADYETIGMDDEVVINTKELQIKESESFELELAYSDLVDYGNKQALINSYDVELDADCLQAVIEFYYTSDGEFNPAGSYEWENEIVEQTLDSLTFEAHFGLTVDEANQFKVIFNYFNYNTNIIADTATTDSLKNLITKELYIPVDLLVSKINNPNIVKKTQTVGSGDEAEEVPYLAISENAELPENTHYDIFVNVTIKKSVDKDNKPCYVLVLNSASAVLMAD